MTDLLSKRWYGQDGFQARLEWGRSGARRAAERGDILVVVDVLSFSSVVATAIQHGAIVYPRTQEEDCAELATRVGAIRAVKRTDVPEKGRYSLSSDTFLDVPDGTRVIVDSPNGATCSRYGQSVPRLFAGSILNARVVAAAAARAAAASNAAITVLACGERWPQPNEDGELRFALEDYLGAGAILSCLPDDLLPSPEARTAVTSFRERESDLEATLLACGSGVELIDKGFPEDVRHAARLNLYDSVPVLIDGERFERAPFIG